MGWKNLNRIILPVQILNGSEIENSDWFQMGYERFKK